MPVKSNFAAGNILTASDTNTYLTNGGLVYITEVSTSALAAAVNIQGCFSATYDNYRMELINVRSSSNTSIYFQMLSGATPSTTAVYNWAYVGLSANSVSANSAARGQTSGFLGVTSNASTESANVATFDVLNPYLTRRTTLLGQSCNLSSGLNDFDWRNGGTNNENPLSYDGIRILAAAGNVSFTARVYGYRQA